MYALIDCNNFYASCERLFRPDLKNRPIIVLSNNDGCAIARSNEAKALGIKMGDPYFKIKALCNEKNVAVFSSNYTFYGDMSARVMSVIEANWPEVEIYSIDEAFLNLRSLNPAQCTMFCERLQKIILKHTGIPTSIGIGQTKTLAKIANHIAKKVLRIPVVDVTPFPHWLDKVAIEDVWGVGRRWAVKLVSMNIKTAGDLARADLSFVRKCFNVVLQRTAYELRGQSCLEMDEIAPKQSIISSKSFGTMQTERTALEEAISAHVARAWEKMRKQQSVVSYLSVFVLSNRFRKDLAQYSQSTGFKLITPTDDVRYLTHAAKCCLRKIFKENIQYKKVGVVFDGLIPKDSRQTDFFCHTDDEAWAHREMLMSTIEAINHRFGRSTLRLAAEGYTKPWAMKRDMKSPCYTTRWSDLPIVTVRNETQTSYRKPKSKQLYLKH